MKFTLRGSLRRGGVNGLKRELRPKIEFKGPVCPFSRMKTGVSEADTPEGKIGIFTGAEMQGLQRGVKRVFKHCNLVPVFSQPNHCDKGFDNEFKAQLNT